MTDAKHSPVKLSIEKSTSGHGLIIYDGDTRVADMHQPTNTTEAQEYAELLARSVNSLPELLEAREKAKKSVEEIFERDTEDGLFGTDGSHEELYGAYEYAFERMTGVVNQLIKALAEAGVKP